MSVRQVHLLGSPVLRQRSEEIGRVDDDVRTLVDDLFETMHAYKGIGLAANQVGLARRVAVVEAAEGDRLILIDPVIVERAGAEIAEEGCLSIPEIYADVERATNLVVETTTLDGARTRVSAEGLKARAIQHEIDHLDGLLFLDRVSMLKRRLLLRKWQRQRKGEPSHLREVVPSTAKE